MGCLCPKINKKISQGLNEKLNENKEEDLPAPSVEDLEANHMTIFLSKYQDVPQKRKLAEFLLSHEFNRFKKHLEEMKNLTDEEFYELFEGNTEYNYSVSNKAEFRELAQKFDDNKDLIIEWYNREDYYNYVLQIWKPNILQKLKSAEDEKERYTLLTNFKIDITNWDDEFRDYFKIIMEIKPTKSYSERIKNYIKLDLPDFDDLIKTVYHCKEKVKKGEDNICNNILQSNLDTSMNRILTDLVPHFFKQICNEGDNIISGFQKKEEENAFQKIKNSGLSEKQKKDLIGEVKKIYYKEEKKEEKIEQEKKEQEEKEEKEKEKENEKNDLNEDKKEKQNKKKQKDILSSLFEFNGEYAKLEQLSKKFNESEGPDKNINFDKLSFKDKSKVFLKNKMVKHAILGLSLANVSYSVLHLTKSFMNYNQFSQKFKERLGEIKKKFQIHKNNVKIIDDMDIDVAIEQIVQCGKDFQSDLLEVEELINEIKDAINGIKTDKNKTISNMIISGGKLLLGIFTIIGSEGEDRTEYAAASLGDFISLILNGVDIYQQNKSIQEFMRYMDEAINLKNQINEEIDKLRTRYQELAFRHFS